jgi:hypothetical protein
MCVCARAHSIYINSQNSKYYETKGVGNIMHKFSDKSPRPYSFQVYV